MMARPDSLVLGARFFDEEALELSSVHGFDKLTTNGL